VFFSILDSLARIDLEDPRGKDYATIITLIHNCFISFRIDGNALLTFNDLACQINIELIQTCRRLYNDIRCSPNSDRFNACWYWLAAIHAILQEPIEDIVNLMAVCPQFAENLFSIIQENNYQYFAYIQQTYECAVRLDEVEIAAKLQHLDFLRARSEGRMTEIEVELDRRLVAD